jgi:hypothetical protein
LSELSSLLCLSANTALDTIDFFTCANWNGCVLCGGFSLPSRALAVRTGVRQAGSPSCLIVPCDSHILPLPAPSEGCTLA